MIHLKHQTLSSTRSKKQEARSSSNQNSREMVSNHEVPLNGVPDRNFYTQFLQHPHGPGTSGQPGNNYEQHQNHMHLSRMVRNEHHYMGHAVAGAVPRAMPRYTPTFDVASMRMRQQSAAMGGNPIRMNINGSSRPLGVRLQHDDTLRSTDDAKKQKINIDSASRPRTGPQNVDAGKQTSKKEKATIANTTIEIKDHSNLSTESIPAKRISTSEQNASSARKKAKIPNNTSLSKHDKFYEQVLLDLESDRSNPTVDQTKISGYINSNISNDDKILVLAGPFVQGVISDDEKVLRCTLSNECNELKSVIREQVEKEMRKIINNPKLKEPYKEKCISGSISKGDTEKDLAVANVSVGTRVDQGQIVDICSDSTKEENGNPSDEKTGGVEKKIEIRAKDVENIVTNVMTKDVDNAIGNALKNVAQRAVKIAYAEVKSRHNAILSQGRASGTLFEESDSNSIVSEEKSNLEASEKCPEDANELRGQNVTNLKSVQVNQKLILDRLVSQHKEEIAKLKHDNARMLKCALLASSHALQSVRGGTGSDIV